jgi:hypothetical protein
MHGGPSGAGAKGESMLDIHTHKPIRVRVNERVGPDITVALDQLDAVCKLLKEHQIPHWADNFAVSLDGRPAVIVINLRDGTNPEVVQAILDSAE